MNGLFWNPSQGFWNARLSGLVRQLLPIKALNVPVLGAIAGVDTCLLFLRAVLRRASRLGWRAVFQNPLPPSSDRELIYIDVGTHRQARELDWFNSVFAPTLPCRWRGFAFEACDEYFRSVGARFAKADHLSILHRALCHPVPEEGAIRLYLDGGDGLSNSICREGFGQYETVPAISFSAWLSENNLLGDDKILLLRMNIEGAEKGVIEDLIDAGLADKVAGYYGMWDDVFKIDQNNHGAFVHRLSEEGIQNFTFNGRDFKIPFRMNVIAYDLKTSIAHALGVWPES